MSKVIMIADKPIWCAKIMNREKSIKIRRNKALYKATMKLIEEQGYATFLMYCTKNGETLTPLVNLKDEIVEFATFSKNIKFIKRNYNGKVVAKFTVRKVEEIAYECGNNGISKDGYKWFYTDNKPNPRDFENASCLDEHDLFAYLQPKEACGSICGFAYHIEDLVIFDKPKELSEFKRCPEKICPFGKCHKYMHCLKPLTKAPQNFCYVESEE